MLLGMTHEGSRRPDRKESKSPPTKAAPSHALPESDQVRDEARPRAGLIRVREIHHEGRLFLPYLQESLEEHYEQEHEYIPGYSRGGLKNCISILSDSGMIGGAVSMNHGRHCRLRRRHDLRLA